MAIVTKVRKDGTPVYYAVVRQNSKQVWLNCGTSIKRAREAHATYVHRANQNSLPTMRDCAFSVLVEKFFADACHDRRPQTVSSYQNRVKNHLLPFFSDVRVRQGVGTEAIQRWMSWEKARGISDSSVRSALTTLAAILSYAVDINLIHENPCRRVRPPRAVGDGCGEHTLTPEQVQLLINNTPNRNGDRAMLSFLAMTGSRPREAAELRFRDISHQEGLVIISRTATRHGVNEVKNAKPRRVAISPTLMRVLAEERQRLGAGLDDLVFPAVRGGTRDISRFARDVLKPAIVRSGLSVPEGSASCYLLRRSLASNLLNSGAASVKVISELLGQSPEVCLRHYTKVRQEDAAAAIQRMEAMMAGDACDAEVEVA